MDVKIEARNQIIAERIEEAILKIYEENKILDEAEFNKICEENELIEFEKHCLYSVLKAINRASFTRTKRVTREEFNMIHRYCPVCFNDKLLVSFVDYIEFEDRDYVDQNSAQCDECGWSGTSIDLVEHQPTKELSDAEKDAIIEEWRQIESDLSYLMAKRKMEESFYDIGIASIRLHKKGAKERKWVDF